MTKLQNLTITIFGGTGFVGRHLVKELCNEDCRLQIPTRDPAKSYFLQPLGDVGQIIPIKCDFSKKDDVSKVIDNADIALPLDCLSFVQGQTSPGEMLSFLRHTIDPLSTSRF